MEAIIERVAGLDVHQGSVVACVVIGAAGRRPTKEVRSFGAMRQDLAALRAWLLELGVTHVGMEGTGVYWQPVHAALEGAFTLIVGNASHMRNVPGRKTDARDAEWIAELVRHGLVRHGLVRPSFVPPPAVRVLRDLVRHRKALVGTLAAERNRTLKLLESAGIKLAGVMSSVFGVSGMLMLRALVEGTAAPGAMADLAKRRLRRKLDRLALALDGPLAEHQRLLLGMHIRRLEEIGRDIAEVEAAIGAAMRPFASQRALLVTIPGVDALTAAAIIAEIGVDMAAFGTARRLAAWAGLCPANHESAGRQKRRGTRKGDPHLKATLVTAAVCAARTRGGTYLRDKFHRLRARMGAKKAAVAIAHKILVAVFHMLQRAVAFADLGADYLDRLDKHRMARRLVRRLDALGYNVTPFRPKAAA
jgi:transposase